MFGLALSAEQQQLGVFGEKSESDEELLAAIEAVDPSAQPPVRSRGRGSRGMQKQGDHWFTQNHS